MKVSVCGAGESTNPNPKESSIDSFQAVTDLDEAPIEDRDEWYKNGLDAIAAGEIALLLLGGGQGTRLGFDKPKGLFVLDLPSKKSLLQTQVERLVRLRQLAIDRHTTSSSSSSSSSSPSPSRSCFSSVSISSNAPSTPFIPFYVMTSEFTHVDTVSFFKENNFFGVPEETFFFFSQGTLPCLDKEGKIIMKEKHRVATAPNGNGGVYEGRWCGGKGSARERERERRGRESLALSLFLSLSRSFSFFLFLSLSFSLLLSLSLFVSS